MLTAGGLAARTAGAAAFVMVATLVPAAPASSATLPVWVGTVDTSWRIVSTTDLGTTTRVGSASYETLVPLAAAGSYGAEVSLLDQETVVAAGTGCEETAVGGFTGVLPPLGGAVEALRLLAGPTGLRLSPTAVAVELTGESTCGGAVTRPASSGGFGTAGAAAAVLIEDSDGGAGRVVGTTRWTLADPPGGVALPPTVTSYEFIATYDLTMIDPSTDADGDGIPDSADPAPQQGNPSTGGRPPTGPCRGVGLPGVLGTRPSHVTGGRLEAFSFDEAVCRAWWLPDASAGFVPQGVALDGSTAWVSGYRRYARHESRRNPTGARCLVARVDLATGAPLRVVRGITAGRGRWCERGGGIALTRHGLWVADTAGLFLLDPARVGRGDPVRRFWPAGRLRSAGGRPVTGSFLVGGTQGLLGIGTTGARAGVIHQFQVDRLAASGRARAVDSLAVPARTRGGAPGGALGGVWTASSTPTSGRVHRGGSCLPFAPGVGEIEVDANGRLWAVLQSGARHLQRAGAPLVPMLVELDGSVVAARMDAAGRC